MRTGWPGRRLGALRIRLGCTGWAYDDWRGPFYPAACRPSEYLERYAQVFDYTEVDSSFYGPPAAEATTKWAASTPEGFRFSLKVPGLMSHERRLRGTRADLDAFLEGIEPLRQAGKLAPLVLQLPPTFVAPQDRRALVDFLAGWPASLRLAVELRHASWWNTQTYDDLRAAKAAMVWSITQYGEAPPIETTDFVLVRFVGDRALTQFDRIQRDFQPIIEAWKPRILEAQQAREAYVVVNNHFMGFAPATARVAANVLGLPAPDLGRAARRRHQAGLAEF